MNRGPIEGRGAPNGVGGYTLIELLTVMVLIGIVLSMAVPRLDFEGYAVSGEVRSVGSELLRAQRRAIQAQHNVVVAIDTTDAGLRIHDDLNGNLLMDAGEAVTFHPLESGVRIGRGTAPALFQSGATVTFSRRQGGLPAIVFQRDGSASEQGGFYLTPDRPEGDSAGNHDTRAVQIQRSTGRPEWFRYRAAGWERGQ